MSSTSVCDVLHHYHSCTLHSVSSGQSTDAILTCATDMRGMHSLPETKSSLRLTERFVETLTEVCVCVCQVKISAWLCWVYCGLCSDLLLYYSVILYYSRLWCHDNEPTCFLLSLSLSFPKQHENSVFYSKQQLDQVRMYRLFQSY